MGHTLASFSSILVFLNTQYNFILQINVKNVQLVSGAGIRTHNLMNIRFLL